MQEPKSRIALKPLQIIVIVTAVVLMFYVLGSVIDPPGCEKEPQLACD